jgi:hypothetical protein
MHIRVKEYIDADFPSTVLLMAAASSGCLETPIEGTPLMR